MSSIKFNQFTKEMELRGSESFIESNFDKIEELMIECFGVQKKKAVQRDTVANREPLNMNESCSSMKIVEQKPATSSTVPTMMSSVSEVSQFRVTRPPLRKYIRKVGKPGHERIVIEIVEQKPKEITLASLKEKFGLTGSKFGAIVRDAEREGRISRY